MANDRFYATAMGVLAVKSLIDGQNQNAIVVRQNQVVSVPLADCSEKSDHAMKDFLGMAEALSI